MTEPHAITVMRRLPPGHSYTFYRGALPSVHKPSPNEEVLDGEAIYTAMLRRIYHEARELERNGRVALTVTPIGKFKHLNGHDRSEYAYTVTALG